VYTTQREGTIAREAMPLEAYVVDWLKPSNKPATRSRCHCSQGCGSCKQTTEPNKPLIMAGCIEGCGQ